jgi:hypothetical protein
LWLALLPTVAWPAARESVPYLVALSILTGVESGITDVDQALTDRGRQRARLVFHGGRLLLWLAQLPLILIVPGLMGSLAYLLALSLGAGVEGGITDVDRSRQERKERNAGR